MFFVFHRELAFALQHRQQMYEMTWVLAFVKEINQHKIHLCHRAKSGGVAKHIVQRDLESRKEEEM